MVRAEIEKLSSAMSWIYGNGNLGAEMMKIVSVITIVAAFALVSTEAESAASCSGWRVTCVKRSTAVAPRYLPECDAKFSACLSSGCFTEGAKFGGATHCELVKK